MTDLVSVIVPIYKVEKYLGKCVDSIINQTYKNLEIILVDDGSPDNSGKICDEYAKKDNRIKVIHKENGGHSSARNAGLDVSTGEFIAFVDSDDRIHLDFVEKLYRAIKEENADIASCYVESFIENKNKIERRVYVNKKIVVEGKGGGFKYYYHLGKKSSNVVWNKLYKRHIFETLRFINGRVYEDRAIYLHLLAQSEKMVFIPEVLYTYTVRSGSTMRSDFDEKKFLSVKANFEERVEFIKTNFSEFLSNEIISSFKNYFSVYIVCNSKEMKKKLKQDFKAKWKVYKSSISKNRPFIQKLKFFIQRMKVMYF